MVNHLRQLVNILSITDPVLLIPKHNPESTIQFISDINDVNIFSFLEFQRQFIILKMYLGY